MYGGTTVRVQQWHKWFVRYPDGTTGEARYYGSLMVETGHTDYAWDPPDAGILGMMLRNELAEHREALGLG